MGGFPGREVTAGLLVALAMIFRLDAALLAGILGLALWRCRRRFPWLFAVAGLLPVLFFLLYLHHTFGAVIPNTMAAKQSELATMGYSYTVEEWRWLWRSAGLLGCFTLAMGVIAAAFGGFEAVSRRGPGPPAWLALVVLLWLLDHELAYRLLGVPFAPWYHVPAVNGLLVAAALGAAVGGWRMRILRQKGPSVRIAAAFFLLFPLLASSAVYVLRQWGRAPDPRWDGYTEAARRIREGGGRSVAAVEIGFLGYESGARVLDLMGLVSPEALAARKQGTLPALVARERPDYLVDVSLFQPVLAPILNDPAIHYRDVAELPDGRGQGVRLRLFRREGEPHGAPPWLPGAVSSHRRRAALYR